MQWLINDVAVRPMCLCKPKIGTILGRVIEEGMSQVNHFKQAHRTVALRAMKTAVTRTSDHINVVTNGFWLPSLISHTAICCKFPVDQSILVASPLDPYPLSAKQ